MSVQLYCGDCLEILPTLADKSVDAVITDPPYNVGFKYNEGNDARTDYQEWCLGWFRECQRIARVVMLTPGIANLWIYPPADWVVCWHKKFSGTRGGRISVVNKWEPVLIYGVPENKLGNDFFEAFPPAMDPKLRGNDLLAPKGHPCPKPVDLARFLLRTCDGPVLDPFMGSGTTGVACAIDGRDFIGCELDPAYFEIAQRRIAEAQRQMVMSL